MIFRNDKGQVVGELEGETFKKTVKRSVHLYGMKNNDPLSWGIDWKVLKELPKQGRILVKDTETGEKFEATNDLFDKHGFFRDFGHGKQVFLPLVHWSSPQDNLL